MGGSKVVPEIKDDSLQSSSLLKKVSGQFGWKTLMQAKPLKVRQHVDKMATLSS